MVVYKYTFESGEPVATTNEHPPATNDPCIIEHIYCQNISELEADFDELFEEIQENAPLEAEQIGDTRSESHYPVYNAVLARTTCKVPQYSFRVPSLQDKDTGTIDWTNVNPVIAKAGSLMFERARTYTNIEHKVDTLEVVAWWGGVRRNVSTLTQTMRDTPDSVNKVSYQSGTSADGSVTLLLCIGSDVGFTTNGLRREPHEVRPRRGNSQLESASTISTMSQVDVGARSKWTGDPLKIKIAHANMIVIKGGVIEVSIHLHRP